MEVNLDINTVMAAIRRECDLAVDGVDKAIIAAGEAALTYLRENSPVDTSQYNKPHAITKGSRKGSITGAEGLYRDGWTIKKGKVKGVEAVTVYNEDCYQLTHLLEYGHLAKNGKFVQPVIHIAKAEEAAIKKLEEELQ